MAVLEDVQCLHHPLRLISDNSDSFTEIRDDEELEGHPTYLPAKEGLCLRVHSSILHQTIINGTKQQDSYLHPPKSFKRSG